MKSYIPYSLLAAAAACGLAFAQETAYTTPVGYTTQTLAANSFNLVGINLQTPTTVAGTLTAVSGTQLSDSNADFTALLPAGSTGVLEILDGPASGTTQEFTTYAGNSITVPVEIANLAAGAKYRVRIATTLSEVFGSPGILNGSVLATNADKVWVPTTPGNYVKYWYKTNAPIGWHTTTTGNNDTGLAPTPIPLVYLDGILVEKKSSAASLVIAGEVKTSGTNVLVGQGFNLIAITPPAGSTLFNVGLQDDVQSSVLATNADKIWVPTGTGTYTKYWYKSNAPIGWHTTTTGNNDTGLVATDVELPSAVFIERKPSGSVVFDLDVPASYSSL